MWLKLLNYKCKWFRLYIKMGGNSFGRLSTVAWRVLNSHSYWIPTEIRKKVQWGTYLICADHRCHVRPTKDSVTPASVWKEIVKWLLPRSKLTVSGKNCETERPDSTPLPHCPTPIFLLFLHVSHCKLLWGQRTGSYPAVSPVSNTQLDSLHRPGAQMYVK